MCSITARQDQEQAAGLLLCTVAHAKAVSDLMRCCAVKPSPPVQLKQPKAVLQQHCQQSAWGPPKFEKLVPGGERLATAGIRYSVSVAVPMAAHGGKKQRKLQQKAFQLGEHEDGWETINDAQNAVATRVLFEVNFLGSGRLALLGMLQPEELARCNYFRLATIVLRYLSWLIWLQLAGWQTSGDALTCAIPCVSCPVHVFCALV